MSDALFAGLPRFDARSAQSPQPASWRRELSGHALHEPDAPAAKPVAEAPRPEMPVAEAAPQPLDLRKIEASLTLLSSRLDKIERDAQAQTLMTIQSMAARLFPELSRAFLAEEISRHLPALVPASAAVIEIRAEAGLAEKLRELVERAPALAHRCTIMPLDGEGQGQAEVSWQTGGLTFDFEGLLQASLSHLNSTHTVSKE